MKRNVIYLCLAILFFLGAVSFYVNTVTIPRSLKKVVIEKAEEFLGRRVSLIDLHFNPFQGFVFTGISVYEKDSPEVFATVAQANVQLLYWPLMRKGKVVLSSLAVDTARVNLIHYASGDWNFTDILKHRAAAPRSKKPSLYLTKLKLTNGRVLVTSLKESFQFSDDIKDIAVTIGLSASKGIVFNASAAVNDKPDTLSMNGNYHPLTEAFSGHLKLSHFNPVNYYRFIQAQLPVTVDSLLIGLADLDVTLGKHLFKGEGRLMLDHFSAHTDVQSLNANRLSLESFRAEWNDGQLALAGTATADQFAAADATSAVRARSLTAQIARWTSRGSAIDATASLAAREAKFSREEQFSAQGDIRIKDVKVSRTPDRLSIEGATELTNAIIKGPNIETGGNFVVPRFSYERAGKTTTVLGDLSASNLDYRWPLHQLTGQIALTGLQLTGQDGLSLLAQSKIQGSALTVTLPGGKYFKGDLTGGGQLQYSVQNRYFLLRSGFQVGQGLLNLSEKLSLSGSPSGSLSISSRRSPQGPLPYSGMLDFKGGTFNGTSIGPVENITGTVSFSNDRLETAGLAVSALGMPVRLSGTLVDFASPLLDVRAIVDVFDLSAAHYLIPHILENARLTLTGKAKGLEIDYKGGLASTQDADVRLAAQIEDGTVTGAAFPDPLVGVSGALTFHNKTLAWEDMNIIFKNHPYTLTGKMLTAAPVTVDTTIEGEELKVHARFNHSPEAITFEQLSGRYKKAYVNVSGTSSTTTDGAPFIDFTGEANIELQDLPVMFPHLPEPIVHCGLSGQTNLKGRFAGDLRHWQDWQFNLTGSAPQFSAWGFRAANVKFNAVQQNNLLKPFHIWGDFYNGEINLVASVDTSKKELPMELVVRVLNSDLNKLRLDTPLKDHTIAGQLSFTGIFNGSMTALQAINGKGGIEVTDGVLWEIDLLKGLSGILLIPEYKDIIFTQAGMNFIAENGIVTTDNIQLIGPTLSLYGKGSLDLTRDQAIKLWLTPDFNSDVILKSSSLKKSTTAIITGTEKFMSVEVTGTLSKPQYKVNKSPVKILQKTGGVILENVSQFFQNIF